MSRRRFSERLAVDVGGVIQSPDPIDQPSPLVLALHGQGMSGQSMLDRLAGLESATVLCPDGHLAFEQRQANAITIGHSWYLYTGDQDHFRGGLEFAEARLIALVKRERERLGLHANPVVVLGYSQGGYLAGFLALRHPQLFAGLVLVSTRFKHEFVVAELAGTQLPRVLAVHARNDPAVAWNAAAESLDRLRSAGADVTVQLDELATAARAHRIPSDLGSRVMAWWNAI